MVMLRWWQARRKARLTTRENCHPEASRASDQRSARGLAAHPAEPASGESCRRGIGIEPLLKPNASLQGPVCGRQFPDRLRGSGRARSLRRQDETLPLSAASRSVVRNCDQLEPRTDAARSDGSRRLRGRHRYRCQPCSRPYLRTGTVRGGAYRDAGRRRYPFQFAPDHGRLRRHIRPGLFRTFWHTADRVASLGAVASRTYAPWRDCPPCAWLRNPMMLIGQCA